MNTSLANANVLANLTPVVVTLFTWLFLKQRPQPMFVLAQRTTQPAVTRVATVSGPPSPGS